MSLKEFQFQNKSIPYYHFFYKGDFYKDLRAKNMVLADGTRINSFFNQKTFEQHNFDQPYVRLRKAAMFIVHYFPDQIGRDLDNYIYKPVIDSLRKTGIFFDDTWQNISLFLLGDYAEQEKIEVFLVPHSSAAVFMQECMGERFQSESTFNEIVYPQNTDLIQTQEKDNNNKRKLTSFW
ncbi:RusA family crossover junction endodeoxyribonuclease [Niallia endozanthoxylica]|uniref:Uncharacterized protein n=1 Tax=Niallia endozanthoxylica TaxID=2036016 RepID=A0A5J5HH43_9BACI|nr:hypothetical protein [Niallia endozanthoxylica]KAA9019023.1 hypothetical protein F4V44_19800 [Niallia endozanthoxylica]